jgi:hypothetical protein
MNLAAQAERPTFTTKRPSPLLLAFFLVSSVWLMPGGAQAHSADEPHDHGRLRAPVRSGDEFRSPRYAAFELRVGPYRPDVDSEFSGVAPFREVFGSGQSIMFGFEADYQALRIPHFGSLGPGVGAMFASYSASGRFADGTGVSAHPTMLWFAPLYLAGVLRIDVLARDLRVPLVPYAKLAVVAAPWEGTDAGQTSVDDAGRKGQGIETGWSIHGGVMLELNFLAPQNAVEMDNSTGINSAYAFGEVLKSDVNSFGRGMQLGTETFMFGLAIEY